MGASVLDGDGGDGINEDVVHNTLVLMTTIAFIFPRSEGAGGVNTSRRVSRVFYSAPMMKNYDKNMFVFLGKMAEIYHREGT